CVWRVAGAGIYRSHTHTRGPGYGAHIPPAPGPLVSSRGRNPNELTTRTAPSCPGVAGRGAF
ncbi:MAG: hypothetical protein AVDCRST_MAG85-4035, partial [uncultured Solirubrobacteraceae bacterium]